jgi:hypothetical protein
MARSFFPGKCRNYRYRVAQYATAAAITFSSTIAAAVPIVAPSWPGWANSFPVANKIDVDPRAAEWVTWPPHKSNWGKNAKRLYLSERSQKSRRHAGFSG